MAVVCSIDWSATGDMLSGIGTIVGAFAVIFVAQKGSDTFKAWKVQKSAERRMSIAEDVLTWTYEFEQVISSIRSPAVWGYESEKALEKLIKDDPGVEGHPDSHLIKQSQVTLSRIAEHQDKWDKLFSLMPASKAYFGNDVFDYLKELWQIVVKVRAAALSYRGNSEHLRKMEARLWEGFEDPDQLKTETEAVIQKISNRLLPEIGVAE